MRMRLILSLACIVIFSLLVGCEVIGGTTKADFGDFGDTSQERAMIDALIDRYGDLRESGSPRILELMVASEVVNHIPTDRVSHYSSTLPEFYVWFIYDNFNEDTITVEWLYGGHSIGTSSDKTGEDFGRGTFVLEAPDDGWPTGEYSVRVSGRGITETVGFEVIDGQTVAQTILSPDGKVNLGPVQITTTPETSSQASPSISLSPQSGSVESGMETGPALTYNVSGVDLGAATTYAEAYHGYSKGKFVPGSTVELWGIAQNRHTAPQADVLVSIYIRYWSKAEPHGKDLVNTGIFKLGSGSTHEYDFVASIPADAHQVMIHVGTTANWSSSVTAHFNATLKP